jgi:beta-glucosidase
MLKNADSALPLAKGAKISVFGKNSVNLVYGGSGSGTGDSSQLVTLYQSLSAAGFTVNPTLKSFYEGGSSGSGRPKNPEIGEIVTGFPTGETSVSSYTQTVKSSYADYNAAALVVFSRIGGEGFDLPRTMQNGFSDASKVSGARSADDHYLQLDQNETDLLAEVSASFSKVIVIINGSASMELGFLDDTSHYAYHSQIKGALWLGSPGGSGINALGRVLNGDVNPSGHTVDTYARNFKDDPTWANFSYNAGSNGNRYRVGTTDRPFYFVDYEEGIYVGYRYYETRGVTEGGTWYDDNVVYPLGYGLSYTSFSWELESAQPASGAVLTASGEITVNVKVKNTGSKAGKDVVHL